MDIYGLKQRWKLLLLLGAVIIIAAILWYSRIIVDKIAQDERNKVKIWADAIVRKAELVKYTDELFRKIAEDERRKVQLWANAYNRLLKENNTSDLTFYLDIISSNKSIPTILTDKNNIVNSHINLDFELKQGIPLPDSVRKTFSKYAPIPVKYKDKVLSYIYYQDSKLFTELQNFMNDLISTFISEIVINSASVPVIVTDSSTKNIIAYGNIDSLIIQDSIRRVDRLAKMKNQNAPIEICINNQKMFIFYEDSQLLTQLKFYPYVIFFIVGLFLLIAYLAFSSSRKSEQDQVWIGMALETAHQLGTPLSSMIAWNELLKIKNVDPNITNEISKDIKRLETITERFSKIGSEPKLKNENISKALFEAVDYIKSRTSDKIEFNLIFPDHDIIAPINLPLFEWVIENLCKNSIDAMSGQGTITIQIQDDIRTIYIDITDTGKGIPKSKYKTIFKPGYTTKQRGWGLGLTLSKRIIEEYHKGKIFVKQSVPYKSTTFRIVLKRNTKI